MRHVYYSKKNHETVGDSFISSCTYEKGYDALNYVVDVKYDKCRR